MEGWKRIIISYKDGWVEKDDKVTRNDNGRRIIEFSMEMI